MKSFFTKEQEKEARKADLYSYLMKYHTSDFKKEGNSIRLFSNHSVSIRKGYSGYYDFSTGEKGNSIDFLVGYMGYTIPEAVLALCGDKAGMDQNTHASNTYQATKSIVAKEFPKQANHCRHTFAYLMKRGIPAEVIRELMNKGLLYQSKEHNNMVFINKERDWAEIRGTYTYGNKAFHGVIPLRDDGYWEFGSGNTVYICEAAIDAVSLFILHKKDGKAQDARYVSIGGVMKQKTIDRLKQDRGLELILAVDNDQAGERCRKKNEELKSIIPKHKDWNEDLLSSK